MKRFVGAALAAVVLAAPAAAQESIKLTAAAAHPPVFLWVKHMRESFLPTVDAELAKTGKYKIAWNEAYGATLAKIGSELETMEQGISDIGMVSAVFQAAKMPLNNVTYFAPYGPDDAKVVAAAIHDVQAMDALKKEWERYNLRYLAAVTIDNYNFISNFPITRLDDLQGRKIYGAGANLNWIRNTGATGVVGSLNTSYNDIKTGVYDGGMLFPTSLIAGKFYEVAPYYTIVDMGAMYAGALAVNKSRWDRFPPEVKAAIERGAQAYAANYAKEQAERIAGAFDAWVKNGGKIHTLAAAERAKLVQAIPNPASDWIKQTEAKGAPAREVLAAYMNAVRKQGYKFVRDWDREP